MSQPLQAKPHLRGWFHVIAFAAAATLCPIVIVMSPGARLVAALYTAATVAMFGISATYHRFRWGATLHEILRRLDHSMIFIVIAATYTPIALFALSSRPGNLTLALVWAGASVGVAMQIVWPHAPRLIVVALYLAVGWTAMTVAGELWHALGIDGFALILSGGLLHSVAALIYATKRPDPWPRWFGFHEMFHLVGTAAITTHYVAVATIVLPMATA